MSEFFNDPIWQQFHEQVEADFEVVTYAVLRSVPTLRWLYDGGSNQRHPLIVFANYKSQASKREDFLVLTVSVCLRTEENLLEVNSDLDRDIEDSQIILPNLPEGLALRLPLPSLKDKSQSEIEALLNSPSIVSELNNIMMLVRSFIKSEEIIKAIITEETTR